MRKSKKIIVLQAERKGATATEYGFVFGIYEFVVFLASPFFGKYVSAFVPNQILLKHKLKRM